MAGCRTLEGAWWPGILRTSIALAATALMGVTLAAMADEAESKLSSPQPEHDLLARFAGEWSFVKKSVPQDGRADLVGRGEVSARMVGSFFALCEWKGDLYGTEFEAVQTFGYSVTKKRYVGTWIDSLMSHQWHFEGTTDSAKGSLIVVARGPGAGDSPTEFRETYHFTSANEISVVAEMKQGDKWIHFMTTELERKKAPVDEVDQKAAPDK